MGAEVERVRFNELRVLPAAVMRGLPAQTPLSVGVPESIAGLIEARLMTRIRTALPPTGASGCHFQQRARPRKSCLVHGSGQHLDVETSEILEVFLAMSRTHLHAVDFTTVGIYLDE